MIATPNVSIIMPLTAYFHGNSFLHTWKRSAYTRIFRSQTKEEERKIEITLLAGAKFYPTIPAMLAPASSSSPSDVGPSTIFPPIQKSANVKATYAVKMHHLGPRTYIQTTSSYDVKKIVSSRLQLYQKIASSSQAPTLRKNLVRGNREKLSVTS